MKIINETSRLGVHAVLFLAEDAADDAQLEKMLYAIDGTTLHGSLCLEAGELFRKLWLSEIETQVLDPKNAGVFSSKTSDAS